MLGRTEDKEHHQRTYSEAAGLQQAESIHWVYRMPEILRGILTLASISA
jgi:hypothetical protein